MPDDTTERWRPVPTWEGIYEVSDRGRLKRVGEHHTSRWPIGRVLLGHTIPSGYVCVQLNFGKRHTRTVIHRLVMAAFVGPCPPHMEVNHKNAIKGDNRLANLEYVTKSENVRHAVALRRIPFHVGEAHTNTIYPDATVASWRTSYAAGTSLPQLAQASGAALSTVASAVTGRYRGSVTAVAPVPLRPRIRFDDATVRVWRRLNAEGVSCAVIARAYGATPGSVWKIVTGKRRGHVR